jgi:quercetin dioxygenase-like cupin family protein
MIIHKRWGHEELIVNNGMYCGKLLHFNPHATGSLHYHKRKHETFHVLAGGVQIEVRHDPYGERDGMFYGLQEGDTIDLPPGTAHRVTAHDQGATLVEFSTTHSDDDVVRIEFSP